MTFLSVRQVAERYSVSTSTVWRWAKAGDLPQPTRFGPQAVRWHKDALTAWETARAAS